MTISHTIKMSLYSNSLKKDMSITVYKPDDAVNPLPVLYFLHGRSGNENIMSDINLDSTANEMINKNIIKPMIIICPNLDNSRGINSSTDCKSINSPNNKFIINTGMYEDYLIKDLIPFIDNTFNTINNKLGRFIGGASAGGYAALHNGLRHQDLFSKIGGHMPAIELSLDDEDIPYFPTLTLWDKYDPISIAKNNSISSNIKFYLDAGEHDEGGFYEGCSILNDILTRKGIKTQNHIFQGHHNLEYIQENIQKYVVFYGK